MTAQIVVHSTREVRTVLRDGPESNGDTITAIWRVEGQLWERLAEGKRRD